MLAIQKYLRIHGLEKTVKDFKLISRDYGHKILLKYNQIESDFSKEEVCDCRGLVLEKETWAIMSMAFRKFFNKEEDKSARIDWSSALVLEKVDGSLTQMYYDWVIDKWCVGTTGTADASGEVHNNLNMTFADLFWKTLGNISEEKELARRLVKGKVYIFELTSPYNIVVAPHSVSSLTLLGVNDVRTLVETKYSELSKVAEVLNVSLVKAFEIATVNYKVLKDTFENMPFSEEGYVVVDKFFKRVKIKNPAYVAAHHLKSKTAEHHIITIIKSNEVDEFVATFAERKDEIYKLKSNYELLISTLEFTWSVLKEFKPKNITAKENKKFAMKVFEVMKTKDLKRFAGVMFSLKDGKVDSVKTAVDNIKEKELYLILK